MVMNVGYGIVPLDSNPAVGQSRLIDVGSDNEGR